MEVNIEAIPTADDPFGGAGKSAPTREMERTTPGPTYEANQGTADPSTGGSIDPHNSLSHADSGDLNITDEGETMNENTVDNAAAETVDGFSDTKGDTQIGSPDPGTESANKPLDPEVYAEAQKEARSEDEDK